MDKEKKLENKLSRAITLLKSEEYTKAARLLIPLLKEDHNGDIAYHLAVCHLFSGKPDAAIRLLKDLEKRTSERHDILNVLALANEMIGSLHEALAYSKKAVEKNGNPENLNNYAKIQLRLNNRKEVESTLKHLIHQYPDFVEGRLQWAQYLDLTNRKSELQTELETLQKKGIGGGEITKWLVQIYISRGHVDRATIVQRAYFERKYILKEGSQERVLTDLILSLLSLNRPLFFDYETTQSAKEQYFSLLKKANDLIPKMSDDNSNRNLLIELLFLNTNFYSAYHWTNDVEVNTEFSHLLISLMTKAGIDVDPRGAKKKFQPDGRRHLRIGIISEIFGVHVSRWVLNWVKIIKKSYPEVSFFIFVVNSDGLNDTIKEYGVYGELVPLRLGPDSLESTLKKIRQFNLDLLHFNDVGMSLSSRVLSCTRLSRFQSTHWTHPVTTGSPFVDYFISSFKMECEGGGRQNYTERLVCLPSMAAALERPKIEPGLKLGMYHKTKDEVFLMSVQSNFKHTPQHDRVYLDLLIQSPSARLGFLYDKGDYTEVFFERLMCAASRVGINSDRIIKIERRPHKDYLNLLSTLYISLDAIGWSGGNTTLNCFALGVPVVASPPGLMRANHTRAMYKLMGVEGLSPNSVSEYIRITKDLIEQEDLRDHYSRLILMKSSKIFDFDYKKGLDRMLKLLINSKLRAY